MLLLPKDIQQARVGVGERNGHGAPGGRVAIAAQWRRPAGDPHPIAAQLRRVTGEIDARAELEELRALLGARVATVPERTSPAHPGRTAGRWE